MSGDEAGSPDGAGGTNGTGPDLHADCARCAGLCCVALAFDAGPMFAHDKPAGSPCRHLAGHACAIHERLEGAGYGGCALYDCQGAGQRVVQEMFSGRSWRETPALLGPMMAAFAALRRIHALLALLGTAEELALTAPQRRGLERLRARLDPPEGLDAAALAALDLPALEAEGRRFFAGLRDQAVSLRAK